MELLSLFILIIAPLTGGAIAIFFKPKDERIYKMVLSFSGAYLFSVSVLHFFPVIFQNGFNAGIYVLAGYFLQLLLEQLTKGIEHGHFHVHHHSNTFIYSLMFGICIHSFFDGIPILSDESLHHSHSMLWAVSVHKIPEGFALASLFAMLGLKRNLTIILLLLFSLTAPAGTYFAEWLSNVNTDYLQIMFAVVGGLMLHVSTTILFESESGMHHFTFRKLSAVIAGALVAIASC